ncbi:MAG: TolC family protein [Candidatus Obscuribacterales bacterium]|nr:TolC family protein [Candidatus Obscuribacterales bacterium]
MPGSERQTQPERRQQRLISTHPRTVVGILASISLCFTHHAAHAQSAPAAANSIQADTQKRENTPGPKLPLPPRSMASPELQQSLKSFKPQNLPAEPQSNHSQNATLSMSPIKLGALIQVATLAPMRLDANHNQPITLKGALDYALRNNLPIKIARESLVYQKAQLYSQFADFLPSFATGYTLTHSDIYPSKKSNANVYVTRVTAPVFAGGADFYTALVQYYRQKGWQYTYTASINDALLDVYQRYTNLSLNHALLRIRAKSVEVSTLQLGQVNTQFKAGTGTRFAIMQSRTQLANDKQALLAQQIATRQSALLLAYSLNLPLTSNLIPVDEYISEQHLLSEKISVDELLNTAIANRPELRQYELFRLAAARNVQVAASNLYPTAGLTLNYNHANTDVKQPTTSSTSTAGAGVFGGLFNTLQTAFSTSWSLPNMGLNSVANIVGARALSRQSVLQANQELMLVSEGVRVAYLTSLAAREQIDNTAYGVDSSSEALRLANLRLQSGMGTNLELIQAQRDYINSLSAQAQAIISSNLAQAQLLHDLGVISIESLTNGYAP